MGALQLLIVGVLSKMHAIVSVTKVPLHTEAVGKGTDHHHTNYLNTCLLRIIAPIITSDLTL